MRLKDYCLSANTGLDAIKRAPILDYPTKLRCIRIQDISQNKDYDSWGYTSVSKADYAKFKLKKNDILVARTGATVGVSYLVKNDCEAVFNNGTIRLRFNELINTEFLFYVMQTNEFRQYIDNISCVATQPNLRVEGLLRFTIPDIPLIEQNKIVDILHSYDQLIENNNKRIKLLEQTSQEIYKEWFVRFRFPGHENAKFESGIPEKWSVSKFSILGEFVRGKNITASEMIHGECPVISAGLEPSGYHNTYNVVGPSITVSSSGANAGYLKFNYSNIWAADCSYLNEVESIYFVYELLNNYRAILTNLQKGAAQPHVYAKEINKIKILLPSEELILKANEIFKDFHTQIGNLIKVNQNLIKQRDLLLPRLMSGKLEVK